MITEHSLEQGNVVMSQEPTCSHDRRDKTQLLTATVIGEAAVHTPQ